jgi:hypothetical protein
MSQHERQRWKAPHWRDGIVGGFAAIAFFIKGRKSNRAAQCVWAIGTSPEMRQLLQRPWEDDPEAVSKGRLRRPLLG